MLLVGSQIVALFVSPGDEQGVSLEPASNAVRLSLRACLSSQPSHWLAGLASLSLVRCQLFRPRQVSNTDSRLKAGQER